MDIEPRFLLLVPDRLKTREMCEKAVEKYLWLLKYVPDWFLTHQQIKIWHDNDDYCNDDELIKWYNAYKNERLKKYKLKELLPLARHPSRYWDWCMSEDVKKRQKNYGHKHRLFFVSCD